VSGTRPPRGLGAAGKQLWKAIQAELPDGIELDGREAELLARACSAADHILELERAVAADGVTVAGSRGQVTVHPALVEIRGQKLAMLRLLKSIDLSADVVEKPSERRARRAATARHMRSADVRLLRDEKAS
jgi:P27 family predicted phage terminase small subunit